MPKISVILPIYNVESYLRECLDSIRNQTLEDIEVLCVNDGSKDGSLAILEEYAAKDGRFKVLDKPNGGYGHSLNYGIARARGEYIAIVEPDDFIDSEMYEQLYSFAFLDGKVADVVKGSYWLYYDGRDGFADEVRKPNLTLYMRNTPCAFKLEEYCEMFCHHPSIWSALYRRGFLEEKGIRFVEPKGAGWADNPFLADTLISAERIVWVPKAFYYYRQTNPGASSFIKDPTIPFDRTREMRQILRDHDVSADIWAALYEREFDYIASTIGEFGFSESDPKIHALIKEVIDDMDPAIVTTHPRMRTADIRFYHQFRMLEEEEAAPNRRKTLRRAPAISLIVPFENDARWLPACLDSVSEHVPGEYEVICVDCASDDASLRVCRRYAAGSPRIRVLEERADSVSQGINLALGEVRGTYWYVLSPELKIANSAFGFMVKRVIHEGCDMAVIDQQKRFVIDAMNASQQVSTLRLTGRDNDEFVSVAMPPEQMARFILNGAFPNRYNGIYRTDFTGRLQLAFTQDETCGDSRFRWHALQHAERVCYAAISCFEELDWDMLYVPIELNLVNPRTVVKPLVLPGLIDEIEASLSQSGAYGHSLVNLAFESFMSDLETRLTREQIQAYYNAYFPRIDKLVGASPEDYELFEAWYYEQYQILRARGLEAYVTNRYLLRNRDARWFEHELVGVLSSTTLQWGQRFRDIARFVLPRNVVGRLRSVIATKQR